MPLFSPMHSVCFLLMGLIYTKNLFSLVFSVMLRVLRVNDDLKPVVGDNLRLEIKASFFFYENTPVQFVQIFFC